MSTSSSVSDPVPLLGLGRAKDVVTRLVQREGDAVHAVLFYGAEGCGKRALAMSLAKAWLCKDPTQQGACGDCAVCRAFDVGRAVDFLLVEPSGKSSLIKVGAITEKRGQGGPSNDEPESVPLITFLRTPPLMARRKVVLIDQADRMNGPTANSLLKTLEEPTGHAKLVLTTSQVSRILPTVRSRCMAVACELPDAKELGEALGEQSPAEVAFGEDTPGLILQVRKNAEAYDMLYQALERSLALAMGGGLRIAAECRQASEALAKSSGLGARAANVEMLRALSDWLAHRRPERPDLVKRATDAHRLIQGNANPAAVLDALLCHIMEMD